MQIFLVVRFRAIPAEVTLGNAAYHPQKTSSKKPLPLGEQQNF
jgi:hypothetical protein